MVILKMKRMAFVMLLSIGALSLMRNAVAQQGWPDFSADVQQRASGQTIQGKVYISGAKTRMVTGAQTIIVRGDKGVNWILMPGQNMYMEQSLSDLSDASLLQQVQGEEERVSEGHEMVGDQDTEKFRITSQTPKGPAIFYQWIRSDGIPAKVEAADGSWGMFYQNIQKGSMDAALFEIPEGYQKLEMNFNMKELMASMENMKGELPS